MMKSVLYSVWMAMGLWCLASCQEEVKISFRSEESSPLVEEYAGVVVPPNIASLNFFVDAADGEEALA